MSVVLPLARTCPFAPPAEHLRLQETEPVAWVTLPSGEQVWALSRIDDIRTMLTDPRFSADRTHPGFPHLAPGRRAMAGALKGMMVSMDPPEHGRARGAVMGEFTARRMAALRPRIQQIVDECIDALMAGSRPVDLVRALSLPVPSLVICHLLGVPYADHAMFQRYSAILLDRSAPPLQARDAAAGLRTYLAELIEAKREGTPGEDLLGRLITERVVPGELQPGELIGMALLLLIAGHETTANMIGLSTLLLLQHPQHLQALRDDDTVADGLVEELLRYLTVVRTGLPRQAIRDVEIGGQLIRAGEPATALLSLANRDDEVFATADGLDPYQDARAHLAFGFGVHQCIGQPLARAELRIALVRMARRLPGLRLATDPATLATRDTSVVYGLAELPVTW